MHLSEHFDISFWYYNYTVLLTMLLSPGKSEQITGRAHVVASNKTIPKLSESEGRTETLDFDIVQPIFYQLLCL